MEDALIEVATIRRFAGIALITDRIPDETMILAFRDICLRSTISGGRFLKR